MRTSQGHGAGYQAFTIGEPVPGYPPVWHSDVSLHIQSPGNISFARFSLSSPFLQGLLAFLLTIQVKEGSSWLSPRWQHKECFLPKHKECVGTGNGNAQVTVVHCTSSTSAFLISKIVMTNLFLLALIHLMWVWKWYGHYLQGKITCH